MATIQNRQSTLIPTYFMAKMKTEFELGMGDGHRVRGTTRTITIIGEAPKQMPYVAIYINNPSVTAWVSNDELERFAVNILKAIKSKKLK